MPNTPEPERQPLVELTPGVSIPTKFVHTASGGPVGSFSVRVHTDPSERVPRVLEITRTEVFEEPPAVAELGDDRLRALVEYAINQQAAMVAEARLLAGREPGIVGADEAARLNAQLERVRRRATAAIRPKPGRPTVDDATKLRALELYRTKGIEAAMEETGRKERTVRRWISDARAIENGAR